MTAKMGHRESTSRNANQYASIQSRNTNDSVKQTLSLTQENPHRRLYPYDFPSLLVSTRGRRHRVVLPGANASTKRPSARPHGVQISTHAAVDLSPSGWSNWTLTSTRGRRCRVDSKIRRPPRPPVPQRQRNAHQQRTQSRCETRAVNDLGNVDERDVERHH